MTGLPETAEVLGPVPEEEDHPEDEDHPRDADSIPVRALIRVPRAGGSALARALQSAQATRSPRKDHAVRVQLDPGEIL